MIITDHGEWRYFKESTYLNIHQRHILKIQLVKQIGEKTWTTNNIEEPVKSQYCFLIGILYGPYMLYDGERYCEGRISDDPIHNLVLDIINNEIMTTSDKNVIDYHIECYIV